MSRSTKKSVVLTILSPVSEDGCAWMKIASAVEWGNIEAFTRCYQTDGYEVRVVNNLKSIENWNKKPNIAVIRKMVREAVTAVRRLRRKKKEKKVA